MDTTFQDTTFHGSLLLFALSLCFDSLIVDESSTIKTSKMRDFNVHQHRAPVPRFVVMVVVFLKVRAAQDKIASVQCVLPLHML